MMIDYARWRDVPAEAWPWANFTPKELAERSAGWAAGDSPIKIDPAFMDRLQSLRRSIGAALIISSGYRSPAYNAGVSSTGHGGPHTTGRAVDILCHGEMAFEILIRAKAFGFTGLGVKQTGDYGGRFLHLDDLPNGDQPRPWVWSYR